MNIFIRCEPPPKKWMRIYLLFSVKKTGLQVSFPSCLCCFLNACLRGGDDETKMITRLDKQQALNSICYSVKMNAVLI